MNSLDATQIRIAWRTIAVAKTALDQGDQDSVYLANYMLRDLSATKAAGLGDLSWAIHEGGSIHKNDVLGLIEYLEKYLNGAEEGV